MKRILSLLLAVMLIAATLVTTGISAFAAAPVKYEAQRQQYNSQNTVFNYAGSNSVKLLYNKKIDKYGIYCASKITKKGTMIASTGSDNGLAVRGNYVYYVDTTKGAIMRCRVDGKRKKTLVRFKKNKYDVRFILHKKRIVYNLIQYAADSNIVQRSRLYTVNLNGQDAKLIAKNVDSEFYTYEDMLYYIKGKDLYRYNFKDGDLRTRYLGISMQGAKLEGMENNIIYFSYVRNKEGTEIDYYKGDVKKQKYWKISKVVLDDPLHSALINEGKIYLLIGSGEGNAFSVVKNEKTDVKPFTSRYTVGGENIGFFKTYIVMDNFYYSQKTGDLTFKKYVAMARCK